MTRLGELHIEGSDSVLNSRLKLRRVFQKLGCDEILTARIEAIIAEVVRGILKKEREINLSVDLIDEGLRYGLEFEIPDVPSEVSFPYLEEYMEKYTKDESIGISNLRAFVGLDSSNRDINVEKIDKIQKYLNIKSREELLNELKINNDKLVRSEEFLQSVMSNIHAVIYTKDLKGNYTFINSEFERLIEKECQEVVGKDDSEIFYDGVYQRFQETDRKVIEKRESITSEQRLVNHEGREYCFLVTKVPMLQRDDVVGICGIAMDITERKKMESEIVEAKKIAEEASSAKARFLANMSHEIRTPMNAIMGMTYLMKKTDLTGKQKDYIDKISTSSEHLLGIINDILDFSKIEAGKMDIEMRKFKLSDVLDNLTNLINQKCVDKGLELVYDIDHNVSNEFVGDPLRIGQVLINLTNNAVKFTEKGEIIVRIIKGSEKDGKATIRFEVEDTGIGLKPEQIERLFQSFHQADASITREYGGTGLGLAISKKLANMMNGEIGVESEFGKGSIFWFTVELESSSKRIDMSKAKDKLRRHKVLIVEDNRISREILTEMLKYMGLKVESASSGEEAIAKAKTAKENGKPYELIYMDMQLPGISGVEAFEKITQIDPDIKTKGIMVTNFGREDVRLEAKRVGMDFVLLKPVSPIVLYESTVEILKEKGAITDLVEKASDKNIDNKEKVFDKKKNKNIRILLAEDNPTNQQVAEEILKDGGFTVDIAKNGAEAVNKAALNRYNLIFMDMQMPVMDGLEATRRIRENHPVGELPIVAMTANAMVEDVERCMLAGMNDHLSKPIDPVGLFDMVERYSLKEVNKYPDEDSIQGATQGFNLHIQGLDSISGCKRVMGKQGVYIKLLHNFIDEQKHLISGIKNAVYREDYPDAKRHTHTLKGVAGNIGAYELEKLSKEYEKLIKIGAAKEILIEKAERLDVVFKTLATEIKEKLPNDSEIRENPDTNKRKASIGELNEAFEGLESHLKRRKPKSCKERFEKLDELEWPKSLEVEFSELKKLVGRYKFKEALKVYEKLILELGRLKNE